jgi:hypothetical protein
MNTTLQELAATIRETGPAAVRKIDEELLVKMTRAALAAVARAIDAAPDGRHKVDGLGVFQVRTVEADPDAKKKGGRRVLFVAKPPKAAAK